MLNPVAARIRVGDTTLEKFMIRWWSGALVRRFGFRIRRFGEPLPGAVLYVAEPRLVARHRADAQPAAGQLRRQERDRALAVRRLAGGARRHDLSSARQHRFARDA